MRKQTLQKTIHILENLYTHLSPKLFVKVSRFYWLKLTYPPIHTLKY